LAHPAALSKRFKLGSRNLHCGAVWAATKTVFATKFHAVGWGDSPRRITSNRGRPTTKKSLFLPLSTRLAWKRLLLIITSTLYTVSLSLRPKVKGTDSIQLLMGNPSRSYGASPTIWDHAELAATRQPTQGGVRAPL